MSPIPSGVLGVLFATAVSAFAQVSISFTHTGSNGFLDATEGAARRAALQAAANSLFSSFDGANVNLTFAVNSYEEDSNSLANASSPIYLYGDDPFYLTVVQRKIISGVDDNAAATDGNINWNWNYSWSVSGSVPEGQFDLTSTAKHELLHAMGFVSLVTAPGTNSAREHWTVFDRYLANSAGDSLISSGGVWQGFDSALVSGQLFFNGPNAVAANGGNPVPLYAPASWAGGSSVGHLDESNGEALMSAFTDSGDGPSGLSAVEIGMLQDLGYEFNVIPEPGSTWLLLSGAAFFLRRRKR